MNYLFKWSPSNLCYDEPVAINKLRNNSDNVKEFDATLESYINLYTKQPEIDYPDGKLVNFRSKKFAS